MDDTTSKFKSIKERFEPIVWLIGSVVVPVIGGSLLVWSAVISPRINQYVNDIKDELRVEIKQAKAENDAIVSKLKNKLFEEIDSTYYFGASYSLADRDESQGPLSQFFYAADGDEVRLYIWTSGKVTAKMHVSFNGEKSMGLQDFKATSWENLDITTYVKNATPLDTDRFPGIGKNVFLITITPEPAKIQPARIGPEHSETIPDAPKLKAREKMQSARQSDETSSDLKVSALLIIRRSPFK
jgi:hypothetical protein